MPRINRLECLLYNLHFAILINKSFQYFDEYVLVTGTLLCFNPQPIHRRVRISVGRGLFHTEVFYRYMSTESRFPYIVQFTHVFRKRGEQSEEIMIEVT
jgi:hypothetical protein